MKNQCFNYKGFNGSIETSLEDGILYGKVLFINDHVSYDADTITALKTEFEAAVDDYLQTCEALNIEPCKPFKGSFNVRVGSELHKNIANQAAQEGVSLNELVKSALEERLATAL